jgi:hypothetical protein
MAYILVFINQQKVDGPELDKPQSAKRAKWLEPFNVNKL